MSRRCRNAGFFALCLAVTPWAKADPAVQADSQNSAMAPAVEPQIQYPAELPVPAAATQPPPAPVDSTAPASVVPPPPAEPVTLPVTTPTAKQPAAPPHSPDEFTPGDSKSGVSETSRRRIRETRRKLDELLWR